MQRSKSCNPFYAYPTWWCAKEWIELANLIPMFHKSGIQNGYNIKYLIRMPVDYFDAQGGKSLDEKDRSKKWADFSDRLSGWMAGQKNVNKSMIVKYLRGADGKMLDNVDVHHSKMKCRTMPILRFGKCLISLLQTLWVFCQPWQG
jgi:hypothetical protein